MNYLAYMAAYIVPYSRPAALSTCRKINQCVLSCSIRTNMIARKHGAKVKTHSTLHLRSIVLSHVLIWRRYINHMKMLAAIPLLATVSACTHLNSMPADERASLNPREVAPVNVADPLLPIGDCMKSILDKSESSAIPVVFENFQAMQPAVDSAVVYLKNELLRVAGNTLLISKGLTRDLAHGGSSPSNLESGFKALSAADVKISLEQAGATDSVIYMLSGNTFLDLSVAEDRGGISTKLLTGTHASLGLGINRVQRIDSMEQAIEISVIDPRASNSLLYDRSFASFSLNIQEGLNAIDWDFGLGVGKKVKVGAGVFGESNSLPGLVTNLQKYIMKASALYTLVKIFPEKYLSKCYRPEIISDTFGGLIPMNSALRNARVLPDSETRDQLVNFLQRYELLKKDLPPESINNVDLLTAVQRFDWLTDALPTLSLVNLKSVLNSFHDREYRLHDALVRYKKARTAKANVAGNTVSLQLDVSIDPLY